ncbi:MAG: trehalose-phosphatase [Desulfuromonadales bacterium GWD2_61_12]|nr:MAG: trehalose-phosphatase [Desulfuromonadales bacterium GWC2_61_20]OGR36947.1 MAG: trehalose-phosphatase [Desulfuromonadales bacterium GWD2_61_12]HAD05113.1 trehalose-phosphatase [Desulfuromonas sp.]HBT82530.1 trehalose-phosphatase [Desulfuromonas sp.]
MTASYLLQPRGLAALARFVAADTLFAFDLDGTLAPIVAEYAGATLDEPMRTALRQLDQLAKVAVVTGRSRRDALAILGFEPFFLIGNHGAEWPGAESQNKKFLQQCTLWEERLRKDLHEIEGIEIEFKGASISLHYRKARDADDALSRIDAVIGQLAPRPKRIGGKFVVNLLPVEALTKGEALVTAMNELGLARAIFFGDDLTDEEVFRLGSVRVLGIHVGRDDQTAATYYLEQQSEMLGLLHMLGGMLKPAAV